MIESNDKDLPAAPPAGWIRGQDGLTYPPAPWHLGATLLLGVFPVAFAGLPAALREAVPDGMSPIVTRGRTAVGVAFVRYHPGGVLAYRELLVALPVRSRFGAPRVTIGQIWVDSRPSLTGGRELWAIPKQLGSFEWSEADDVTRAELVGVAGLVARPGRVRSPVALRVPLVIAQQDPGRQTLITHSQAIGAPGSLLAEWAMVPDGPLGYLAGRRPAICLAVEEASLTFGLRSAGKVCT